MCVASRLKIEVKVILYPVVALTQDVVTILLDDMPSLLLPAKKGLGISSIETVKARLSQCTARLLSKMYLRAAHKANVGANCSTRRDKCDRYLIAWSLSGS